MNLQRIHIDLHFQDKGLVEICPFDWYIGFSNRVYSAGDLNHHTVSLLCFKLYFSTLSEKGKEGRRYREGLKKSGEWNPDKN